KARGVLASGDIAWLDLGLYPTPGEEKLFLQDLYMALASSAEIVAFTRYDVCHSGFLGVLSALVQRGKSPLANRYVLQNDRLLDVGTALVQDAVSELTPRGKYLVFVTDRPLPKLADSFGAPFVSALGDVCETAPLTKAALSAIAQAEFSKLCTRAKQTLQYDVTADDTVKALAANAASGDGGAQGVLTYWDKTYRALAQYKLEHGGTQAAAVLCAENGRPAVQFDGEKSLDLFALLPGDYTGELAQVKAEFDSIIGLTEIKKYILSLEDNYTAQLRRKAQGLKTASVSMHMIFTGSPGTGKTTIARLVSKYLKAIGVLSGGQLVEVSRADLVGKYVGHTAPLTTQVIRSAIGGVLFIDEAYSLYRGKDDSFGLEAIDTLVKCMEDNRDNLIVILAGYSKEMAEFLTANSGLKSRFPNIIEFPDYTGAELLAITKLQAKGKGYKLDAACDGVLLPYFNTVQLTHAQSAGNGRLARNKIEEAILNQSKRLAKEPNADLSLLMTQDFVLDDIDAMT
ncbi:MAG: AAA family ATPase, partial [Ruthenibacterium sp.]